MRSATHCSRRLLTAVVALLVAVAGCGPIPTPAPPTAAPSASTGAGPSSPGASPSSPGASPSTFVDLRVAVEPVIGGLDGAIFVTSANDGTGRLFVAQQGGVIRIFENGALLPTPFVDLSDRIAAGGERGLLGLAFPPGFGPERPDVFVHYSDTNGDTTVARFTVDPADPDRLDPATEEIVLTQQQPYPNHNGGWIGFDPDGMLLIALGDGGAGGDPENRASDLGTILGKLLRIDVLGAPDGAPYSIPADNPFVGRTGARGEILHYGLRNPFRDSVDLETGDLWIGDVGQNAWEEVDVARAGASGLDFGWRRWEGRHCYDTGAGCVEDGVTMPVAEYPHADGCSVIGGVVYRGDAIPALRGAYLFADYCSGTLWALDAALDGEQAPTVLTATGRNISSIGIDEDGEVWLTDVGGGALLRLVAGT